MTSKVKALGDCSCYHLRGAGHIVSAPLQALQLFLNLTWRNRPNGHSTYTQQNSVNDKLRAGKTWRSQCVADGVLIYIRRTN